MVKTIIMKNLKILSILLFAIFFVTACCQDEEIIYSCNEKVNEWTKANISKIKKMSRDEWNQLDETKKIAAYRAFSSTQKKNFWKEKFLKIKKLSWNERERRHIKIAEDFLNTHLYFFDEKELSDEQNDSLEIFYYTWKKAAIENLGWNENLCAAILLTGNDLMDTSGNIVYRIGIDNGYIDNPNNDCDCSMGVLNACGLIARDCERNSCEVTNIGCGILWLQSCDGQCSII